MKHIIESDMYFGDYLEENFFKIENSKLHLSFGEGIKIVVLNYELAMEYGLVSEK